MSPSFTTDESDDFDFSPRVAVPPKSGARTLLLAPPSISAHPEALDRIVEAHDRSRTDIQMLDRLALGLISLPAATYDIILLLTDADGTRSQSQSLVDRAAMTKLYEALKVGGRIRSQDGTLGKMGGQEKTEAILAGLIVDDDGLKKPDSGGSQTVQLRFGKKKTAENGAIEPNADGSIPLNLKRKSGTSEPAPVVMPPKTNGLGFVDFSDDLDELITGEDDDLIDEDELLTEADLARPIVQPPECQPKPGKRRRACKDCSCGLKEKIEAEDAARRAQADKELNTMRLDKDEMAEVDFTIQGKVGSCGNCALGDAFRCDGCPYIGLPAFKPGEEVRLLNDDIQL
ncbi:electron carrier [Venturia effusa]|uniref:Electron carrier n=1 Tax=Venturia effusa TaxID=50376 RepID=A0A517LKY5_9PEZI|nr:electron carrier [Venturia effusa]